MSAAIKIPLSLSEKDLLDLTPEKYDICISIVVMNGEDSGTGFDKPDIHGVLSIHLHFRVMEATHQLIGISIFDKIHNDM